MNLKYNNVALYGEVTIGVKDIGYLPLLIHYRLE